MSIENRDLKAGTRVVARYKGQDYSAEVVETSDGIRYKLGDGREFKSLSSAGSAVMGGTACNGWRFWTVAGEEGAKKPKAKVDLGASIRAKSKKPAAEKAPGFERLPDEGVPEGQAKFFCNSCMDAFTAPAAIEPIGCPKGHSPNGPEEQATA